MVKDRLVVLLPLGAAIALALVACTSGESERPRQVTTRLETGDGGATCTHPVCATGVALTATCDPCATKVCLADAFCCGTEWDTTCVAQVKSLCGVTCTAPPLPPADAGDAGDASTAACAHDVCAVGGVLEPTCDPCATQVCAADAYCCGTAWDTTCVSEVSSICGRSCQ
jgi:hypothetical protein